MRRLKLLSAVYAAALVLLPLVACAPAASPSAGPAPPAVKPAISDQLQTMIDAARQEGQLTFIWGDGTLGGSEGVQRLADGFNKAYGLNLEVRFTPGPSMAEMAPRLVQEYQANRRASTDVVIGYAPHMFALIQGNALEAVDWLAWAPYVRNPELLAPNGVAVTFQTSTPGITYNSSRLTGDAVPRSMQDLLKPQYKGRIASTPYAANFDYLMTDDFWGEQRTADYLTRLADQVSGLIRCNETERLVTGEFDVLALDCSQSNPLSLKGRGAPVDFVIPADAALIVPLYMAVPRHAAHPNAAKLWVNYMLSREPQDYLYATDFMDSHLLEGSRTAKDLEQVQQAGVKLATTNVEFVQRQDEAEYSRRRTRAQEILRRQ